MSRTYKDSLQTNRRQRRISVRGVRRTPADVRKLGRALIQLALDEAAAEAAAQEQARKAFGQRRDEAKTSEGEDD